MLRRLGFDQPDESEPEDAEVNNADDADVLDEPEADEDEDDRPLAGGLDPYDVAGDRGRSDPRSLAKAARRRRGL